MLGGILLELQAHAGTPVARRERASAKITAVGGRFDWDIMSIQEGQLVLLAGLLLLLLLVQHVADEKLPAFRGAGI